METNFPNFFNENTTNTTRQTMDLAIMALFKETFAWEFYPSFGFITATDPTQPFENGSVVLSLGSN